MTPRYTNSPFVRLREVRDQDGSSVCALISAIFAEYENCLFVLEEMPELLALRSWSESHDGRFWVAEDGAGSIAGCVGCAPFLGSDAGPALELKKLYVRADMRKSGLGSRLVALVEAEASRRAMPAIELWSDTKFTTAHAFYERRGYVRTGRERDLHDKSDTREFEFRKARPVG